MSYQTGIGMQEMSELDVLQMLGRAGRPQFDSSAIAVIMTRQENVSRWKQLVSGEEILESWQATWCIHPNFANGLQST
jgi:ATP-dependent DNA helicase HFM1/MER3